MNIQFIKRGKKDGRLRIGRNVVVKTLMGYWMYLSTRRIVLGIVKECK